MIKVDELRIGNLIFRQMPQDKEIILVEEIRRSDAPLVRYYVKSFLCPAYEHELSGIPLTENWMEKFGMVTLDNEIDQIIWGFEGPKGDNFCYVSDGCQQPLPIYFEYDSGTSVVRKEIKWVHELQNLHFALIGEELQIKKS